MQSLTSWTCMSAHLFHPEALLHLANEIAPIFLEASSPKWLVRQAPVIWLKQQ